MILTATATVQPSVVSNQKLMIACWATVIVFALMALVFFRSKRRGYGFAVLPLTIPPAAHIVSGMLARTIDPAIPPISAVQLRIIIDLAAALVACAAIGLVANFVSKKRKPRLAFIGACTLFVIVFSSFLIMSSVVQFAPVQ